MMWLRRLLGLGKRAISSLPWVAGGPSNSGQLSTDKALRLIPFFACVRLLADSVAALPLQAYRKSGGLRLPLASPPALLDNPAAVGTRFAWMHKCVVSLALRGNAYGLVLDRDWLGRPTMIEWLHPDEVHVDDEQPTRPRYYWQGREVASSEIVHIAWFTLPGRVAGLSPVSAFAHSIGVGLSATRYGASWFERGGQPPATFKNTQKTIDPEESEAITERLTAKIRRGEPLVYGADWDYTGMQVTPEDSQFIQTMKLNATQIAAIFGIPPEMVGGEPGGSLTYANVEQQALNFVTFTLQPWLVRLEAALSSLLPRDQYVRFNADAMARADLETRYRAHHLALTDGWMNRDEVRVLEERPPLPDGQGATYAEPGQLNPLPAKAA
ncbi:phage portal protein [Nonomuraea dietziae]|uniref:phage portal protein n=1 Tax=Nonomuraea dietziae TaxID=65515 RepID=UPI00341E0F43